MKKRLVIILIFGILFLVFIGNFVECTDWLPSFGERIEINVTNINNSYVTYYQNTFSFNSSHVNFNKLTLENQIVIADSDGVTKSIPFYVDYLNSTEGVLNITFLVHCYLKGWWAV